MLVEFAANEVEFFLTVLVGGAVPDGTDAVGSDGCSQVSSLSVGSEGRHLVCCTGLPVHLG